MIDQKTLAGISKAIEKLAKTILPYDFEAFRYVATLVPDLSHGYEQIQWDVVIASDFLDIAEVPKLNDLFFDEVMKCCDDEFRVKISLIMAIKTTDPIVRDIRSQLPGPENKFRRLVNLVGKEEIIPFAFCCHGMLFNSSDWD